MTTNETDRTEDRVSAAEVFASGEAPSDESPRPDRNADEIEVDEFDVDEPETDEVEDHDGAGPGDVALGDDEPLVADATSYHDRWYEIQTGFVDEPTRAVQSAGELLTKLIDDLNRRLTSELEALDEARGGSDDVSTEDLRVTFQRYRSFFDRLMTA